MRVLILVLSGGSKDFDMLCQGQKDTWDSVEVEGVDTIFYHSSDRTYLDGKDLYVKCPPEQNLSHYRLKLALDYIFDSNCAYDFIFRTNASSYVDKARLLEHAKHQSKTKCYNGKLGGGFASGCGFLMSTDLINILRTMDDYPSDSEDCLIGVYLERAGIKPTDAIRWDFHPYSDQHNIPKIYHYRCKSDDLDRTKDIKAFHHIHNLLGYA